MWSDWEIRHDPRLPKESGIHPTLIHRAGLEAIGKLQKRKTRAKKKQNMLVEVNGNTFVVDCKPYWGEKVLEILDIRYRRK